MNPALVLNKFYHILFEGNEELVIFRGFNREQNECLFNTLACRGLPKEQMEAKVFLVGKSWNTHWGMSMKTLGMLSIKKVSLEELPLYVGYPAISPIFSSFLK